MSNTKPSHKMKITSLSLLILLYFSISSNAQTNDSNLVEKAGLNYIEGFYEGDTLKLKDGISSNLFKYGYWKNSEGKYSGEPMTYKDAIDYAKSVFEGKKPVRSSAPKNVEILDVQEHIAAIKITAWWGIDYALLSKKDGLWKIDQVLWQGPISTIK